MIMSNSTVELNPGDVVLREWEEEGVLWMLR